MGKIVQLIENAQSTKPPIQRLVDKIAGVFVQIVLVVGVITFLGWYLLSPNNSLDTAFINFVAVLIVACPCALGLATPTAILVGTGLGAANGILVKDASILENMYKARVMVFDKTGTLTTGTPVVKSFNSKNNNSDRILQLAVSLEANSEHPYAIAIYKFGLDKGLTPLKTKEFRYLVGSGVRGIVDANNVMIGSKDLLVENGIDFKDVEGRDKIFVSVNEKIEGYFLIEDELKSDAHDGIAKLQSLGIETIMLTGDNENKAEETSKILGTSKYLAAVKPDGKAEAIRDLQTGGEKVIMIGDGINDAPALVQSDIGIAMGAGTDIAIDSAKIILIKNKIEDVVKAYMLSKKTTRTIKQNLFWAFIYNIIGIPLAAFGMLNPMIAALAMSFSSVSVVTNSLRLKKAKLNRIY